MSVPGAEGTFQKRVHYGQRGQGDRRGGLEEGPHSGSLAVCPEPSHPGPLSISVFVVLTERSWSPHFGHGSLWFLEVAAIAARWLVAGAGVVRVVAGRMDSIQVGERCNRTVGLFQGCKTSNHLFL